jgi:hypothetical protein
MESIDPHGKCLKPLLDEIAANIIEVTAQIAPREGGQVAHPIDEKRRSGEVVFLGYSTSENFLDDRCRETERTVGLCDAHDSISSIARMTP